jgi:hypothetical protein
MEDYTFDETDIREALEVIAADNTAKEHHDPTHPLLASISEESKSLSAGCISVKVKDGKVCINLPLGLGKTCIGIPRRIPNGTAAEACLKICSKFGIPTGVKVTISIGGKEVVSQTFGKC